MDKFIRVDEWKPAAKDQILKYDGKLIIIPFNKIFNNDDIGALNVFNIIKVSYVSYLADITKYINYFIKFYDKDNELLLSYFKLKYLIDNKDKVISLPSFIQLIYSVLLSESIREKIIKMVEDNYYIDVSTNDGKEYNESLEFTVDHAKVMMQISIAMKMMVPVMFHYINKLKYENVKKKEQGIKVPPIKDKTYIYRFYAGLFDIFGEEIDIYNKLWISIWSKVNTHYARNKIMWDKRTIFDTTLPGQMNDLIRDKIICETMFKYVFEKNIIHFNYVILKNQFMFFNMEKYKHHRIELTSKKDVNGLSGLDKLEMNATKIDESIVILSEVNIKKTIKQLEKRMNIKISKEEIEYYKNHMKISKFQVTLVFWFYAKYFGSYRDLNFLNRTKYIKLLLMLKKRLQFQGFIYLPSILTANIDGRISSRTIRNTKFLSKIESSSIYQTLINDKYPTLEEIGKGDVILNTLSTIINTKFTFVEYDNPEVIGDLIELNNDIVSEEFLNYLNQL